MSWPQLDHPVPDLNLNDTDSELAKPRDSPYRADLPG